MISQILYCSTPTPKLLYQHFLGLDEKKKKQNTGMEKSSWTPAIAQEPASLRDILLKAANKIGMSLKLSDAGQAIENGDVRQIVDEGKIGVTLFQKNPEEAAKFWRTVSELQTETTNK